VLVTHIVDDSIFTAFRGGDKTDESFARGQTTYNNGR
jgi:hypothetical protein